MDYLKRRGFSSRFKLICVGMLVLFASTGASPEIAAAREIPDLFVSMPGDRRPVYALVVEKSSQQITLFKYDGQYQVVDTMKCSTGKARGDKRASGDKKTPEGAYFFTGSFGDQDLAPLYGTRAFPLDYPNFIDRREGRNGYAIWMHGTNRPLRDRDSNGCIALVNRDIDKLSDYIALKDTPILIADKVTYKPIEQAVDEDAAIRTFLTGWKNALAKGTYHDYLAHYDPGYLPDIAWWMDWLNARKPGPQTVGVTDIQLSYLGIYKHRDLYVAIFDQKLSVEGLEAIAGRRKIFLSFASGAPRIVGDTPMASGDKGKKQAANSLVRVAQGLRARQTGEAAIAALFERWLAAWSGKDIMTYGDCYAVDFRFKQMNRQDWITYKKRLNKTYRYIQVSAKNIKIERDRGTATVTFVQTYESSAHKAEGVKTLLLKMENEKWKIFRETYIRN